MPSIRVAVALVVGSALVFGLPVRAAADEDGLDHLKLGGHPLAALVRTEPMAPFVAFEAGYIDVGAQASDEGRTVNGGKQAKSRRKTILVSGAMGAGAGLLYGFKMCENQVCPYLGWLGLVGLGAGLGIGAALSALDGK